MSNPFDIMIDLETWGLTAGCDIRSIGAVVFNPGHGLIGNGYVQDGVPHIVAGYTFHTALHNPWQDGLNKFKYHGFYRSEETQLWWSRQSPEARAALEGGVDMYEGLKSFCEWLSKFPDAKIWANDPHFDVAVLEYAFHWFDISNPWHHRSIRSQKTITELAGLTRDDYCSYGDAHNALHDAIAQAMTVSKAYAALRRIGHANLG